MTTALSPGNDPLVPITMREVTGTEVAAPGSDEWLRLITPSKVAAIVGVSRWESPYGLWMRMKGRVPAEPPQDKFAVGHAWEPSARELWKLDGRNHGWRISSKGVQYVVEGLPFPAAVTLDRRASTRGRGPKYRRVVEFKITGSYEDWGDDYSDNAPADYLVQVLMQMAFTGWTHNDGHLMVLGPTVHKRHIYPVLWRPDLVGQILRTCSLFYRSLDSDTPPPLDDHKATYECVRALHPGIERGKVEDVPPDVVTQLRNVKGLLKDSEERERGLKTRLLDAMGDAQYARVGSTIVADRRNGTKGVVALVVNKKPFDLVDAGSTTNEGETA